MTGNQDTNNARSHFLASEERLRCDAGPQCGYHEGMNAPLAAIVMKAPDGSALTLAAGAAGVEQIRFDGKVPGGCVLDADHPVLREAVRQLSAYFNGDLRAFDLPLTMRGTEFQRRVWVALREIPYGETRTYGQIAASIGSPKAVRAVGAANGQNPIPIVVPCHRVIGSNGKLVGFGGGLGMKRLLLAIESGMAGLNGHFS